ncbi:MAG: hypothetical protein ACRDTV_25090, partial [Mycobacterium sp.]
MSEGPRGDGWWQASDLKWYPPEQHPNYVAPPPAPEPVWQQPAGGDIAANQQLAPPSTTATPPPYAAPPSPRQPLWRPRVVIPSLVAVLVLIGGGVFAAVKLYQRHHSAPAAATFTGTYTAAFGPDTDLDGKPEEGAAAATGTWAVRSACRSTGCAATATASGAPTLQSTFVFDYVGGQWTAVGADVITSKPVVTGFRGCPFPAEEWEAIIVQP